MDPEEYIGWSILNHQVFEPISLSLAVETMKALEGATFVDVGAHHGLFSVAVGASTGCAVVAVEGQSSNFTRLLANVRLNPEASCFLVNCCASADSTLVHLSSEGEGRSAWTQVEAVAAEVNRSLVAGLPLELILEAVGIENIGLMKIDVEGYELQVFQGLNWSGTRRPQHILMECNRDERAKLDFLVQWGYAATAVDGRPLGEIQGPYPEGNVFFCDTRR